VVRKNKDPELHKVVFDLKKSNYNLILNYCQFEDLINIQNDSFSTKIMEFDPETLIKSVLSETEEILDFRPCLEAKNLPPKLFGDDRIKYILSCLIQSQCERTTKGNEKSPLIKISAYISDEQQINLSDSNYQSEAAHRESNKFVVTITDFGGGLSQAQIDQIFAASVVKRVIEAMGGKLEAHA